MGDLLHPVRFRLDHRWAPARMSEYLDASLPAGSRRRMERHLAECGQCRRLLGDLRALLGALHRLSARGAGLDAARMAAAVRLRVAEPTGPQ